MKTKFGILAAMTSAQDLVSSIIANINPAIIHAVGKYVALSKIFYYSALENVEGDYLEFGVYAGSSLSHAIKCYNKSLMYVTPPRKNRAKNIADSLGLIRLRVLENYKIKIAIHSFNTPISLQI